MDKKALIEEANAVAKEQLLEQIHFAKKERKGERELCAFDGFVGLLFLLGAAFLLALQGILSMDPVLRVLGAIFGFLLSAFFFFLSYGHFKKQKEKTIFIKKSFESVKD